MVLRNAEIVDVAGLADFAIAHANGKDSAVIDDYLTSEGPPVLVDAHGPSGHIKNLPRLMARMTLSGDGLFHLKGLSPTEDPRCPGGKDGQMSLTVGQLATALQADLEDGAPDRGLARWRCALSYREVLPSPPGARGPR